MLVACDSVPGDSPATINSHESPGTLGVTNKRKVRSFRHLSLAGRFLGTVGETLDLPLLCAC